MPRSSGPKRATRWLDTTVATVVATGGVTQGLDLLAGLFVGNRAGATIVRTLVDITFMPIAAPTDFYTVLWKIGGGILSEEAVAAVALPDLNDDTDFPLRGWTFKLVGVNGANPTEEEFGHITRVTGDFRSMRKLELDSAYFMLLNMITTDGIAPTLRAVGMVRTLLKI